MWRVLNANEETIKDSFKNEEEASYYIQNLSELSKFTKSIKDDLKNLPYSSEEYTPDITIPYNGTFGEAIFHIDNSTYPYEVSDRKVADGYFYAILYHPSFLDIKLLKKLDEGKYWFRTRNDCIKARVDRMNREIEVELMFSDVDSIESV